MNCDDASMGGYDMIADGDIQDMKPRDKRASGFTLMELIRMRVARN